MHSVEEKRGTSRISSRILKTFVVGFAIVFVSQFWRFVRQNLARFVWSVYMMPFHRMLGGKLSMNLKV